MQSRMFIRKPIVLAMSVAFGFPLFGAPVWAQDSTAVNYKF